MKTANKILAGSMAAAMAFSMVGCGSTASSTASSAAPADAATATSEAAPAGDAITVWTLSNDLKQFAEQYTAKTGTKVDVVVYDSADYVSKVTPSLGGKTTDVDVFVGEPQMMPNFYEAGFCADLSELADEANEKLVPYVVQAGTDTDGVLRSLSYQATPGSVIYRRDLATEVFGTDDPDEIGKKFASFDEIAKTADELKAKGYSIFGDTGSLRWFSTSTNPWVKDGEVIIDDARKAYFDTAVKIYQNGEVANCLEWSAPWYNSMAGALPIIGADDDVWSMDADSLKEQVASGAATTQVFSYVMPSWGALIVRDNAGDNKGKFGVCSGVTSFFGGGTFLAVNEYSKHKETAVDFIKFCTLNEETSQWWLEASEGDVVSMKSVLDANKDYENASFGNQKTYAFYSAEADKIDYSLITGYDDAIKDAYGAAIVSVQKGQATKEDAMKTFYETVKATYPELTVPEA
ncbi:MAG: extracellular solute-binding protein [Gemmiger sp.]|nr:extracellular solute-binding protein [Gemmiger sp.]